MSEPTVANDTTTLAREALDEVNALGQFWFVAAMYAGWSLLVWFSRFTGSMTLEGSPAKVLMFGVVATNILFYLVARSDLAKRPGSDTLSLAQCVVGIAWATLLTYLVSDTGALAIGLYVSIVLYAMPRVKQSILSQIILFAIISYSMISFVKILVTDTQSIAAGHLYEMLIFALTMLCLSSTSKYVLRKQRQMEAGYRLMQSNLREELAHRPSGLEERQQLFDYLRREKGRTDRKNVPFSLCVFGADEQDAHSQSPGVPDAGSMKTIERAIRHELRDMDAVNRTGWCPPAAGQHESRIFVLLPETNLSGARTAAERLLATVTAQLDEQAAQTRLCIGIAQYRRGETIDAVVARAESALVAARATGVSDIQDFEPADVDPGNADVIRLSNRRR